MTLSRRTFSLGAGVFAAAIGAGRAARAAEGEDMTIGAAAAPLHLVEYASLTCPHCAAFHHHNWERLKTAYIEPGHVKFSFREMATAPASVALAMFQLARCGGASADEYMRRVSILFEQQQQILATGSMTGVRDWLVQLGIGWGLTQTQIRTSLIDPTGPARIMRSMEEASHLNITGTPAFLLNGERLIDPEFQTLDGMTRILDARLAR